MKRDIPDLPRKGLARTGHGMREKRVAEAEAKGAFPVWQLSGAGAVGSQVIMGLPMLARLRQTFDKDIAVWPFEPLTPAIAIVEIWPSLIAKAVNATMPEGQIKDAHQVQLLAQTLSGMPPGDLTQLLEVPTTNEGWILGLGHEGMLERAALGAHAPPPLKNDCFAMPQGAHWTPVDYALQHLRDKLTCVTSTETVALKDAADRFLAQDVRCVRSHPPPPMPPWTVMALQGPHLRALRAYNWSMGVLPQAHPTQKSPTRLCHPHPDGGKPTRRR
ncbi:hypothetical protein [Yoonia sp. GPGPB17]|uniref:hypothetical protein n=1 Tax=Yoonia sp. GPGPB17 TaxID=3026147 RepID=UPI0030EB67DB